MCWGKGTLSLQHMSHRKEWMESKVLTALSVPFTIWNALTLPGTRKLEVQEGAGQGCNCCCVIPTSPPQPPPP